MIIDTIWTSVSVPSSVSAKQRAVMRSSRGSARRRAIRSSQYSENSMQASTAERVWAASVLYSYILVIRDDQSSIRRQWVVGTPSNSAMTCTEKGAA